MDRQTNIIDFSQHRRSVTPHIVRLLPELDGLEMLYTNDSSEQVFSIKVLCWALHSNGEIDGIIPWLNQLVCCRSLNDPLNGHWEGYIDPITQQVLFEAPEFKAAYLKNSEHYYNTVTPEPGEITQEVADIIGTHAVFTHDDFQSFSIQEVHSWRLFSDGTILAMAIEPEAVEATPVLPGDECLYSVQHHKDFRYFFQYRIANKLKAEDPDALAAMSLLSHT